MVSKTAIGIDSIVGPSVPKDMIPQSVREIIEDDKYQMILISSEYKTASDEVNAQIDEINKIVADYDENGMLIGEAPCTKDLITITDTDFKVVSAISIVAYFCDHCNGVPFAGAANHSGGSYRVCNFCKYVNSILHAHINSVYCIHCNRNHSAGCDC